MQILCLTYLGKDHFDCYGMSVLFNLLCHFLQSMWMVTQAKVAFCLLSECTFITFLHEATLLHILRNIAWDPEVVKKMKWEGTAQARCTCRDFPSPKYQSSVLRRLFICVYGSKKRYWQHRSTGNSAVCTLFMWGNEIILCSYFYFTY